MSIKTPFNSDCDKYWTVTTNKKMGCYGQTRSVGVVAKSVADVSEKMSKHFPDEIIVTINHRGPVDI